jgi:hypothetical protein
MQEKNRRVFVLTAGRKTDTQDGNPRIEIVGVFVVTIEASGGQTLDVPNVVIIAELSAFSDAHLTRIRESHYLHTTPLEYWVTKRLARQRKHRLVLASPPVKTIGHQIHERVVPAVPGKHSRPIIRGALANYFRLKLGIGAERVVRKIDRTFPVVCVARFLGPGTRNEQLPGR